jgi:hypothetical protein
LPDFDPNALASATAGNARLGFLPADANRAATVIVTGASPIDLDTALESLKGFRTPDELIGSPQGLRDLVLGQGVNVHGGESLSLAEFGLQNREFSGRVFHAGFDLALPVDMVPADYANISLALAGGYASGLAEGAQILIEVNGHDAAGTALTQSSGDLFHNEHIALPLGLWRPGRNSVEISAFLPNSADLACDTRPLDEPRSRFLLLNATEVHIPRLARALRVPDLAVSTGGALPYLLPGPRPRLLVPTPDADSMSAAATFVVQMALSAGRVIDFSFGTSREIDAQRPTLVVSPAPALDPSLLRRIGVDPDQLRNIWQARADASPGSGRGGPAQPEPNAAIDSMTLDRLRNDVPAACALPPQFAPAVPIRIDRPKLAGLSPQEKSGVRQIESAWQASLGRSDASKDRLAAVIAKSKEIVRSDFRDIANWFQRQRTDPPIAIESRASLVIAQNLAGQSTDAMVTLVTAPNSAVLQASVTCLTAPSVWNKVQGRLAILDANDGSLATYEANHTLLLETESRNFQNLRLVFAGWLSLNPTYFMAIIMAAAICLGLSTNILLRRIGRPNPRQRAGTAPGDDAFEKPGSEP